MFYENLQNFFHMFVFELQLNGINSSCDVLDSLILKSTIIYNTSKIDILEQIRSINNCNIWSQNWTFNNIFLDVYLNSHTHLTPRFKHFTEHESKLQQFLKFLYTGWCCFEGSVSFIMLNILVDWINNGKNMCQILTKCRVSICG